MNFNKVVIVTGCVNSVAGYVCEKLAETGCKLVMADSNWEIGMSLKDRIENSKDINFFHTDFSDLKSVDYLIEKTISLYGKLDIIVNFLNRNIYSYENIEDVPVSFMDKYYDVYMKSVFYIMKIAQEYMEKDNGHILNVFDDNGTSADDILYFSMKEALNQLVTGKKVNSEKNIRLNNISISRKNEISGKKSPVFYDDMSEFIKGFIVDNNKSINSKIIRI